LNTTGCAEISDQLDGSSIILVYEKRSKSAYAKTQNGSVIVFFEGFIDALKDFYPEAQIYPSP